MIMTASSVSINESFMTESISLKPILFLWFMFLFVYLYGEDEDVYKLSQLRTNIEKPKGWMEGTSSYPESSERIKSE